MRLFEAMIKANHRAIAGDKNAALELGKYESELPVIALTCIDPRLNPLLPNVLGLPQDQFIWLRNAGNIITSPLSSTMRSLALACAVKGGREITVIGHTDCLVCKTSTMQLLEKFKALGVERHLLPENINEYFGMFASERQNVIKACEFVRNSPLIGSKIAVHGLMVDIQSGELEWVVNGYQHWPTLKDRAEDVLAAAGHTVDAMKALADFQIGEMKFPETKIGEAVTSAADWLSHRIESAQEKVQEKSVPQAVQGAASIAQKVSAIAEEYWPKPAEPAAARPPRIPAPPMVRPRMKIRKAK